MKLDLSFGAGCFLVLVAATLIVVFQNPEVKLSPKLQHVIPGDQCDLVNQLSPMHPFRLCLKYKFDKGCREDSGVRPSPFFLHEILVLWTCMLVCAVLFSTYRLQPDTSGLPGMLLKKTKTFLCALLMDFRLLYRLFWRINQRMEGKQRA